MYDSYLYEHFMLEAEQELEKEKKQKANKKVNFYLRDNLQVPFISPILKVRSNRDKLVDFTGDFIDKNSEKLFAMGPMYNVPFYEREINFLSELFNIEIGKVAQKENDKVSNDSQLMNIIKGMFRETYGWTTIPHTIRVSPHKVLLCGILIDALQNGYDEVIACCEYLIGLAEYPLFHKKYLSPKFDVRKDVMQYTIEHLPIRFRIKKVKNILELIKYDVWRSLKTHKPRLLRGDDMEWVEFINRVRNAFNSTYKKIAQMYHANAEKDVTIFTTDGKLEDGSLVDKGGHGTNMSSIIENTYTQFISSSIHMAIIPALAEEAKIPPENLTNSINTVFTTKNNKLHRVIEIIITSYFVKTPTASGVGTADFLSFGLQLFRQSSNSKNPLYIELKDIINELWVKSILDLPNKYSSQGTINNYARAIFRYIVFMIKHHN